MGVVRERHPEVTQKLSDLRGGPTSTQKSSPTNKGALRLSRFWEPAPELGVCARAKIKVNARLWRHGALGREG